MKNKYDYKRILKIILMIVCLMALLVFLDSGDDTSSGEEYERQHQYYDF